MGVYRISLSNAASSKGPAESASTASQQSSSTSPSAGKLTTFAQQVKSVDSGCLTSFTGLSSRGASNFVIKIPVHAATGSNPGSSSQTLSTLSEDPALEESQQVSRRHLDLAPNRSQTVSVLPTVGSPVDGGTLRVYVPAPERPPKSSASMVFDPCGLSPLLETRLSLSSSGQLSPSASSSSSSSDNHDSGLSSNGTTPPPQHRRRITTTAATAAAAESDTDSNSSSPDSLGTTNNNAHPLVGVPPGFLQKPMLLKEVQEVSRKLKPVAEALQQRQNGGGGGGGGGKGADDARAAAMAAPKFASRTFDERFSAFESKWSSVANGSGCYDFHLSEIASDEDEGTAEEAASGVIRDDTFVGVRMGYGDGDSRTSGDVAIKSVRGTVRGVKNRVRAGIATFQQQGPRVVSYQEKEAGKLVMYTTNLGVIRDTYHKCQKVKTILRTLLVKFEERDLYLNQELQAEFRERTQSSVINVPLVYKEGVLLGDAEKLEKLNETGELRRLLKPFKRSEPEVECKKCGGYRMLPCGVCNGSKKSSHRNNFTLDFIALKCMNCDEAGLVKCDSCNNNH